MCINYNRNSDRVVEKYTYVGTKKRKRVATFPVN